MKRFASILLICLPLLVKGQIVLDGNADDAAWRILALVNTTGTPNTGFGSGNTLGVLKYHSNATTLFLAVTGDVNANNNIVVFIDNLSYSGRGPSRLGENMRNVLGPNVFRTSSGSCPVPEPNGLSGARMDAGFDADYAFAFNKGNTSTDVFLDVVRFSNYLNDGTTNSYLAGPHYVGSCNQSGATASHSFNITNWNTNGNQISFAWLNGYDASTASNRGVELAIPYAALPGFAAGQQCRFFVLLTNYEGLASNVCIPGDPNTIGNSGSASNLNCSFNLSTISNFGKDVFYTEPTVVLPLSFLGVKAGWVGEAVRVDWSVAEQGEANYYEVERSADGVRFERIGVVAAREQGSVAQYSYVDNGALPGRNLYRIVARKRSGARVYSRLVEIENQSVSLIGLYPNPVTDKLFVRLGALEGKPGNWSVFNEMGQRVLSGQLTNTGPIECIVLPPALPVGTYRFSLASEGKIAARSFVKGR